MGLIDSTNRIGEAIKTEKEQRQKEYKERKNMQENKILLENTLYKKLENIYNNCNIYQEAEYTILHQKKNIIKSILFNYKTINKFEYKKLELYTLQNFLNSKYDIIANKLKGKYKNIEELDNLSIKQQQLKLKQLQFLQKQQAREQQVEFNKVKTGEHIVNVIFMIILSPILLIGFIIYAACKTKI